LDEYVTCHDSATTGYSGVPGVAHEANQAPSSAKAKAKAKAKVRANSSAKATTRTKSRADRQFRATG
jgi:hypothetical protein